MDRLRAEHITKSFDGTTIIQDVSLTLHEDELICLLGVSGVGKSIWRKTEFVPSQVEKVLA